MIVCVRSPSEGSGPTPLSTFSHVSWMDGAELGRSLQGAESALLLPHGKSVLSVQFSLSSGPWCFESSSYNGCIANAMSECAGISGTSRRFVRPSIRKGASAAGGGAPASTWSCFDIRINMRIDARQTIHLVHQQQLP